MRIVHVLDTLDPVDGGPPQVAIRQASALAGLGHDVSILHCRPTPNRVDAIGKLIQGTHGHERVRILEIDRADIRKFAGKARGDSLDVLRGAEWLQLHQIWHPMLRAVADWARRNGVPYSLRPAGSLSRWMLAQKRWKKRLGLAIGYRKMIDGAAFLQALNKDEAHEISFFGPRVPVEIISNGIFPSEVAGLPPRGAFVASHPTLAGRRLIVSVGRLHYSKGFDTLLDAFIRLAPRHRDLDLVLVGPDGGARADLESRARAAGLGDRLHLPGAIYGREKFAALVDADVFCLPSHHEAFSNAIIEAMACSLPCVISKGAHFPEVAERRAGLVVDIDAKAVADAIESVLADPSRRVAMGTQARELAHSYLWPEVGQRLADTFARYRATRISGGGTPRSHG
jgi:glycosyltransferase involved in cell wall biosynthesis